MSGDEPNIDEVFTVVDRLLLRKRGEPYRVQWAGISDAIYPA